MGTSESRPEPLDSVVSRSKHHQSTNMDRLKRSLRESFRRRKEYLPECSKPHQWQEDEQTVRSGICSFHVKGLIVDQTIEKVSFCAPDRYHERGFSYICRDGATRRWMCHGFLATRDSGERLSHAVGCAFAVCLERKQKRDKEAGVSATFDLSTATFSRFGSFKAAPLAERKTDPQECRPTETPPVRSVNNPYAIERPHATPSMLQRQLSFRGFPTLSDQSPFKRQLSLRLGERGRSHSLDEAISDRHKINGDAANLSEEEYRSTAEGEALSELAQQVTHSLALLSSKDEFSLPADAAKQQLCASRERPPSPSAAPSSSVPSRAELWLASSVQSLPQRQQRNHHHIPLQTRSQSFGASSLSTNPFNASLTSNNPFACNSVRTFEVHL